MNISRVCLVHLVLNATHAPNHGLTALGGALRVCGLNTLSLSSHIVKSRQLDLEARGILEHTPEVILISFMSNQASKANQLAGKLRELDPGVRVFGGGHHISALGHDANLEEFHLQVSGEGEHIIGELLRFSNAPSELQKIIRAAGRISVGALDDLPLPAIDIFTREDWLRYPSVMFSRGCPFKCSYCMSRNGGEGGKVRWKSPQRAVAEIDALIEYANPAQVFFDDDTLLKNPKWVREFCSLYKEKIKRPFYCNARPETVRRDLVSALREAGCVAVGIGIESGSKRIRTEILRRPMSDTEIIDAFTIVHDAGLETWSFNMVGLPTETAADVESTIRLNGLCDVKNVRVSIFTPLPGADFDHLGIGASVVDTSYFRRPSDLEAGVRRVYEDWISQLRQEGRLWLADEEVDALGLA